MKFKCPWAIIVGGGGGGCGGSKCCWWINFWLVGCFRCCCCWINFFDGKKYKICWLEATTRSFFAFNRHSTDVFMSIIFISENRKTKIFDVLMMIIIFLLVILFETINSIFCLMRKIKLYFFPTYLIFMFFFTCKYRVYLACEIQGRYFSFFVGKHYDKKKATTKTNYK